MHKRKIFLHSIFVGLALVSHLGALADPPASPTQLPCPFVLAGLENALVWKPQTQTLVWKLSELQTKPSIVLKPLQAFVWGLQGLFGMVVKIAQPLELKTGNYQIHTNDVILTSEFASSASEKDFQLILEEISATLKPLAQFLMKPNGREAQIRFELEVDSIEAMERFRNGYSFDACFAAPSSAEFADAIEGFHSLAQTSEVISLARIWVEDSQPQRTLLNEATEFLLDAKIALHEIKSPEFAVVSASPHSTSQLRVKTEKAYVILDIPTEPNGKTVSMEWRPKGSSKKLSYIFDDVELAEAIRNTIRGIRTNKGLEEIAKFLPLMRAHLSTRFELSYRWLSIPARAYTKILEEMMLLPTRTREDLPKVRQIVQEALKKLQNPIPPTLQLSIGI